MIDDPDPNVTRMTNAEDDAIVVAGAHARRAGTALEMCPYVEGTNEWCCWRSGWRRPSMYIGGPDDD